MNRNHYTEGWRSEWSAGNNTARVLEAIRRRPGISEITLYFVMSPVDFGGNAKSMTFHSKVDTLLWQMERDGYLISKPCSGTNTYSSYFVTRKATQ